MKLLIASFIKCISPMIIGLLLAGNIIHFLGLNVASAIFSIGVAILGFYTSFINLCKNE